LEFGIFPSALTASEQDFVCVSHEMTETPVGKKDLSAGFECPYVYQKSALPDFVNGGCNVDCALGVYTLTVIMWNATFMSCYLAQ
jgi:hypothetical protein